MGSVYGDLSRPPLDEAGLRRALVCDGSRWSELRVAAVVPSTNAELVELAADGAPDGLVLVAEHQTAGRGRLDRSWAAPPRSGITMSALIRPAGVPAARWSWLPLIAGLAVAAAVQSVAELPAELKWPNDVVVGDRKLGGLLVQRAEAPRPSAIVGIGLNVTAGRDELPAGQATSLLLEGARNTDRQTIVTAILRRLDGLVAAWEHDAGVASQGLQDAYRSACCTLGRPVSVALAGSGDGRRGVPEPLSGVAAGIDADGRLLVRAEDGEHAVAAGDVVHLRGGT